MSKIKTLKQYFRIYSKRLSSVDFYKNLYKWKRLKGQYKGKRVFIIANGPSLNITPLYLLKNEYTIMFNRILLMLERLNYSPSFYMIVDGLVGPTIKEDIKYFLDHCDFVFTPDITKGDFVNFKKFVPFNENVLYMYQEPFRFSYHLPFANFGGSVIIAAFQVLKYLGFDEVIVVGNDMNYVLHTTAELLKESNKKNGTYQNIKSKADDDPNHFDPRYFGKGKEYHQPNETVINNIFESLNIVNDEFKKSGVSIINAGYNSHVNCFPKMDFYEVLGYSNEHIKNLFEDLILSKGFDNLNTFLNKVHYVKGNWEDEKEIVGVPTETACDLVKIKILNYLPVGPFNDHIYFINRKILNN